MKEMCYLCTDIIAIKTTYSKSEESMIKVYVMPTCPDCTKVMAQVKDNPEYLIIDIGAHVRNLKEFLYLRDNDPVFDAAKRYGFAGIPCFVLDDGTVTLSSLEAGITPQRSGTSCRIDGSGC